MRKAEFVPASRLYDVKSRTPIAHPAHQAIDEDVRRAVETEDESTARYTREKGGGKLHTTTIDNSRKRAPVQLENGVHAAVPADETEGSQ
ncbi:hypothetical protein [Natrinema halophilum]|uniref:hypothetical protein n=1 Tax=Natrinema halophilum TaxID=1699371 RepID=UPI001F204710|nr:hypothetical protein [Natrinema halophilum]UHQ96021.1 hypothetical protein HYG82_21325 [Natrinema halophilum]